MKKFEVFPTRPEGSPEDVEIFLKKQMSLMTEHLRLMQEQLDLPAKIDGILLQLGDRSIGTEEGDRLRGELNVLEERNRTIHLSLQKNWKELEDLREAQRLAEEKEEVRTQQEEQFDEAA